MERKKLTCKRQKLYSVGKKRTFSYRDWIEEGVRKTKKQDVSERQNDEEIEMKEITGEKLREHINMHTVIEMGADYRQVDNASLSKYTLTTKTRATRQRGPCVSRKTCRGQTF